MTSMFLCELDYLADHEYLTIPSTKGQGMFQVACRCGWAPRDGHYKTEAPAKKAWDAHMKTILSQHPQRNG